MPNILIKVGATGDSSLASVFTTLTEASKRARTQIQSELDKLAVDIPLKVKRGTKAAADETSKLPAATKKATDASAKEYEKLAKEAERWHKQMVRDAEKAMRDEVKAAERAAADKIRIAERTAREEARVAASGAAAAARAQQQSWGARDRFNARTNSGAANVAGSVARGALSMGTRLGGDLVRGIGVNTDLGSMFSQSASLEKGATDLSNSGYMPGKAGAAGQRQDPNAIMAQVRQVSTDNAIDPAKAMEGLQAFVSKTGDLETGRNVLADMAKLSRATGASMEDMVNAAGDVSNGLGDVPDKAAKVAEVMRSAAAMGKEGAVEIKDLASQMAKMQAAASQFTGDGAKNMGDMVALAQMTRAKGGAASATQAATSVTSFTNTFSKGARLDKFQKYGVETQGTDGKLRNSRDIIIDALRATGGDNRKMGEMFADVRARSVTRGFETTYKEAGGGEAGIEAVRKAFDDLANATMKQTEVNESFAVSMNTTEAKVQVFNNQMAATADQVRANLMPALVALAPAIISATQSLAGLIGQLTGKTENDADAAGRGIDSKEHGDMLALRRDAVGGEVKGTDVKRGEEDVKAMDAAIAQKKKQIEDKEYSAPTRFLMNQNGLGDVVKAHDEKQALDQAALASMVEENKQMKTLLHQIANGELKVKVTNPHDIKPTPGPAPLPPHNPGAVLGPKVVHQ